jgi:hypothetical protein
MCIFFDQIEKNLQIQVLSSMLNNMNKLPSFSKPVSKLMTSKHHDLDQLFQKLYEIRRIKKIIMPWLEATMQAYVDISYDFKKQILILIVANDAVAMRLRFQLDELEKRLKAHPACTHIQGIRFKTQSYKHSKYNKATKQQVALLSEKSADAIHTTADTITHPALKNVMQRIAKRIKQT